MSYHESLGGSGGQTAEQKLAHDLESARPQTLGEEELQLQLALAMSKEEAEAEEKLRKNDDLRLQLALSESQKARLEAQRESKRSAVDDLLSLNPTGGAASDPWGAPLNGASGGLIGAVGGVSADPWSSPKPPPIPDVTSDPWNPQAARSSSASNDPWQPSPPPAQPMDPWAPCDNSRPHSGLYYFFMNLSTDVMMILSKIRGGWSGGRSLNPWFTISCESSTYWNPENTRKFSGAQFKFG